MTVSSTSSTAGNAVSNTGSSALQTLNGNFNQFLTMLTAQLQNQDPTNPMDTQSFTTELVQFSGVEQQIATNTNLTQLVQLTQAAQVMQGGSVVGHTVSVTGSQLALQNGQATLDYTASVAGPATMTVSDAAGHTLYSHTVTASAGSNSWTWDGRTSAGTQLPDGAYTVGVTGSDGKTKLPFTVRGLVTGVQNNSGTVTLQMGGLSVGLSALTAMLN
jgi:flagellar basal-body rod modification protein FlgD